MTWYVVDGMDGSGKTTTARSLQSILESDGRTVTVISHPNRESFFGKLCSGCLLKEGCAAKMFATGFFFADVMSSLFKMKRTDTDDVIFVRYLLSVAYISKDLVKPVYRILSRMLPEPDYKIYKDVEVGDALERVLRRGDELEMFENYDALMDTRHKMSMITDDWYTINGRFTPSQVEEDLRSIIGLFNE